MRASDQPPAPDSQYEGGGSPHDPATAIRPVTRLLMSDTGSGVETVARRYFRTRSTVLYRQRAGESVRQLAGIIIPFAAVWMCCSAVPPHLNKNAG